MFTGLCLCSFVLLCLKRENHDITFMHTCIQQQQKNKKQEIKPHRHIQEKDFIESKAQNHGKFPGMLLTCVLCRVGNIKEEKREIE